MRKLTLTDKILRELHKKPRRSSWQYAKLLRANSSVVSGILHSLENRGLVSRQEGLGPGGGYGWFLKNHSDV